jgi:general secretion pathway protein C
MQHIPTDRSTLAQTTLVFVIHIAALILLAGMLAYWGSVWIADSDHTANARHEIRAAAQTTPGTGTSTSVASDLFGIAQPREAEPVVSTINVKLLGVVAASSSRHGYAVLKLDEKQILAAHEGEDIVPGVILAEVHPYHIVVEHNGLRETFTLPKPHSSRSLSVLPEAEYAMIAPQTKEQ